MVRTTNLLKRQTVEQRLQESAAYPVTFVCAPIGYGKTTAVKEWLRTEAGTTLWISGVPGHEELFWQRLCQTFGHHFPDWAEAFASQCFPLADAQAASFIGLLNRVLKTPCVLVIDDYHFIASKGPLQHFLYVLALEQLPLLRVICVGRHVSRGLAAELRTKELCDIIGPETLALNRDEVEACLSARKVVEAGRVASLAEGIHAASEGWAAAVFLMIEGLRHGEDVSLLENAYRLFERAVFDTLAPYDRLLLIKLSLFEEFTLAEATFVLESTGVFHLVEQLDAHNIFISHNVVTNAYRLHALFRNFLQHKASFFDLDARHLQFRMGLWHLDNGDIPMAFRCHYKAGRMEEFFGRLSFDERFLLPPDYCDMFHTLICELPEDTALRHPFIFLYMSLLLLLSGHKTRMQTGKRVLRLLRRRFMVPGGLRHPLHERLLCELRLVSSLARFNNPYLVFRTPKGPPDAMLAEVCRPLTPFVSCSMGLPSLLYCYYRRPGEMDAMVRWMIANFDPDRVEGLCYGFDKLLLAEMHLERLEIDAARRYAEQAILKSMLKHQHYIAGCAHFVLVRLAVYEGDIRGAFARLDAIRFDIPASIPGPQPPDMARLYATFADLCETYLLCVLKNLKRILARLSSGSQFARVFLCRGLGVVELGRIKIKILSGEFAEAEVLCDFYEREFAMYHTQLGLLRCKVFRAVILRHLRQTAAARQLLREALVEAARDRLILLFAENADFILPLLKDVTPAADLDADYLLAVNQACRQYSQHIKNSSAPNGADILTSRELDVFQQLTRGQSQKSMARELGISVSTVKRHLESIYAKFGVNNRVAALNKGIALGL